MMKRAVGPNHLVGSCVFVTHLLYLDQGQEHGYTLRQTYGKKQKLTAGFSVSPLRFGPRSSDSSPLGFRLKQKGQKRVSPSLSALLESRLRRYVEQLFDSLTCAMNHSCIKQLSNLTPKAQDLYPATGQ